MRIREQNPSGIQEEVVTSDPTTVLDALRAAEETVLAVEQ